MPPLFPPDYPARPDAPLLSFGPSFSEEIARSVIAAVWHENAERPQETEIRVAASLTMLEAFHPRDHLECMLAAQGVAVHAAMMECLRRAMLPEMTEIVAIKLRASAAQMSRSFSVILRDVKRLQTEPEPQRPAPPPSPPASGSPPGAPSPHAPPHASPHASPLDGGAAPAQRAREAWAPAAPIPDDPARNTAAAGKPRRTRARGSPTVLANRNVPDATMPPDCVPGAAPAQASAPPSAMPPFPLNLDDVPERPEDIETRPDGTPGSLAAYAPKPPVEVFVPREPAIMLALATRPKPWRMVNTPKEQAAPGATPAAAPAPAAPGAALTPAVVAAEMLAALAAEVRAATIREAAEVPASGAPTAEDPAAPRERPWTCGPLDLRERIFTGDALSRFASARFDPDAPAEPMRFDDDEAVVELELISTGGDPGEEARRAAMMAAHPEGKPIVTYRYGGRKAPEATPDLASDGPPDVAPDGPPGVGRGEPPDN